MNNWIAEHLEKGKKKNIWKFVKKIFGRSFRASQVQKWNKQTDILNMLDDEKCLKKSQMEYCLINKVWLIVGCMTHRWLIADERLISSRAEEPLFEKKPEFKSSSYPIYDKKYNVMEIHDPDDDPPMMDDPNQKEIMSKFTALHHPDIARAYWWQGSYSTVYTVGLILYSVLIRTLIEAAFLFGQYWMFGFEVPLKINCLQYPCPTMTECWVSRAMEKTIFLWFMFIVGKCYQLV